MNTVSANLKSTSVTAISTDHSKIDDARNPDIGHIIQMEIGALLVGHISNHPLPKDNRIQMGDEKGFFEYGGSTIIILIPPEIAISPELRIYQNTGAEIPTVQGYQIT